MFLADSLTEVCNAVCMKHKHTDRSLIRCRGSKRAVAGWGNLTLSSVSLIFTAKLSETVCQKQEFNTILP